MIARSACVLATMIGCAVGAALSGCGGGGQTAPDGGDASGDTGDGGLAGADGSDGGDDPTAIAVDTPSGFTATETRDGYCDILEAVAAAAARQSVGDCANPNGVARVALRPGRTYPVRRTVRLSAGTEVGVAGGGEGGTTISATAGFFVDPGDASSGCLVYVTRGDPDVSMQDVTLTQDPSLRIAGACIARGGLNLRRVRVTGFGAGGIVASCLPISGCDHEAEIDQATILRVLGSRIDGNRSSGRGAGISSEGSGSNVFIAHSAIVDNASDNDGGGLFLGGGWGNDIIQSSTISGNTSSGAGGGVFVRFAEATNTYVHMLTTTIANNTAAGTGGGIEFQPAQLGVQDVSIFSSVVAGNFSLSTLEWNINSVWDQEPKGLFNCIDGSLIYVAPGHPRPSEQVGAPCRFDVRNALLGPLMPLGGAGGLPLHPLLDGSPAVDGAPADNRADDQRNDWVHGFDPTTPADWSLFDSLVDGDGDGTAVRDLGAYERNARWQTELLAVRGKGAAAHTVVTVPAGYDRGAGTTYAAAGVTNEFVTYGLPAAEPGRYDLRIGLRRTADSGRFSVAVADGPAGPWIDLAPEQDAHGTGTFVTLGPFVTPFFASPGEMLVRFKVTGRNPSSSGHRIHLDFIEARRRGGPCPVADVAVGGGHSCALMEGGGVRCWGANVEGQLGEVGDDRPVPPAVDLLSGVVAVAAGTSHTCVLGADGGVRCWGGNGRGQLGDGSTTGRKTPPGEPVLSGVKAIAAGRAHTCALMTGGGVRCWGANDAGQLGDGSLADRLRPPGTDLASDGKAITAGGGHTCLLTNAGGVRCWGKNDSGQLGDGTHDDRSTPPPSDVIGNIAAVSAGDLHTCVVTSAGGLRCWGHNFNAEAGMGHYDPVLSPPATDVLTGVKQVVASNLFTCALTTNGGVRCWGYNEKGAIGDETEIAVDRLSPAAADVLTGVASLAASPASTHVCARMTGGGVRCWGANDGGQLGDGMRPIFAITPPSLDGPGFTGTCQ